MRPVCKRGLERIPLRHHGQVRGEVPVIAMYFVVERTE
jgi:hypothetical protein